MHGHGNGGGKGGVDGDGEGKKNHVYAGVDSSRVKGSRAAHSKVRTGPFLFSSTRRYMHMYPSLDLQVRFQVETGS
jgi:hypothetical protein